MNNLYIHHPTVNGYWQTKCLDNIAEYLSWLLDAPIQNHIDPYGGTPICLGVHYTGYVPDNGIIFNTEQLHSDSQLINGWYRKKLSEPNRIVMDYHDANVSGSIIVPVGYCDKWAERFAKPMEKDIQVLSYGSINFRRQYVLEQLLSNGISVLHANHIWGDVLDNHIARSKFVLHTHFYPDGLHAPFRTIYAAHGARVISEDGAGVPQWMDKFNYNDIESLIRFIKTSSSDIIAPSKFDKDAVKEEIMTTISGVTK